MTDSSWPADAAIQRAELSGAVRFGQVLHEGDLMLGMYTPMGEDAQQPHVQDELYFVVSGSGTFVNGAQSGPFSAGDAIFVPAGVVHRFEDFSEDFATWVVFWGAKGGKAEQPWPPDADPGVAWTWPVPAAASAGAVFSHGSMSLKYVIDSSELTGDGTSVVVVTRGSAAWDLILRRGDDATRPSGSAEFGAWVVELGDRD